MELVMALLVWDSAKHFQSKNTKGCLQEVIHPIYIPINIEFGVTRLIFRTVL